MRLLFLILFIYPSLLIAQSLASFKNATAFVYAKDSLGKPVPNGTCFIIGKKLKSDSSLAQLFFVTAKHVLQNPDGSLVKDFFIRMNTLDSNSRLIYYKVDTTKNKRNVFFHKDNSVDIAVFMFSPTKSDYNFRYIPESLIPDKSTFKSLNIEEGNEAFFAGLFVPYTGEQKIFPIFRFGYISLITDERIMWVGEKRELILMEISSFGGNSGAPVYFKLQKPDGSVQVVLGGVLSGTFRDVADISIISTSRMPVAFYNNGISGVTPVYFLNDIIYSPEFLNIFGQ
jgi:hypothetical protein